MTTVQDFHKRLLDSLYNGVYFLDRERRITYWNKACERITGFAADEVLGSRCADNVLVHVDSAGRCLCHGETCPAAETIRDGQPHEAYVYLRHKSGHRVPVTIRTSVIRDEKGEIAGAVEVFEEGHSKLETEERLRELERLALLDPLTGVGNRRYAESHLDASLNLSARAHIPFAILMIDVDQFKAVNDQYGHHAGDQVLRMVARTLFSNLRSFDHVARWGGDEFLVILMNVDQSTLSKIAEKIRALAMASACRIGSKVLTGSVCVGATLCTPQDTTMTLVDRADRLLYQSKHAGRNRVTTVEAT